MIIKQLKTAPIYYFTVPRIRSLAWHDWVLCSGYHSWHQDVGWAEYSSGGSVEKSTANLTQVIGRIEFIMVVGLKFLLPC